MGGARPDTTAHAATVPRSRFARKLIGVPFRLKVGEEIER
jgi:hypothetical protein